MADTKTAFCSVVAELPTNERNELIKEYLASYRVSNKVRDLLESFII